MSKRLLLSNDEVQSIQATSGFSPPESDNRRSWERMPYPTLQPLGPYGSWGLPKKEMFFDVRCHDISRGGISFFLPEPPEFQLAVMALGRTGGLKHFFVRILYTKEHPGPSKDFLVGACFLRRLTGNETEQIGG